MNLKRPLLIGAAIATVTLGGGGMAMAATDSSSTSGTSIVNKIASKFNLNTADVQAVFDADHAEKQATMEADQKAQLKQAVTDGKLTQAQADHIQGVRDEIKALIGTTDQRDLSDDVRTQIKQKMDDLKQWADDNNIDNQYVRGFGHGHGGFDGRRPDDDDNDDNSTHSSSSATPSSSTDDSSSSATTLTN